MDHHFIRELHAYHWKTTFQVAGFPRSDPAGVSECGLTDMQCVTPLIQYFTPSMGEKKIINILL